jgi:hypothetical protein
VYVVVEFLDEVEREVVAGREPQLHVGLIVVGQNELG